MQSPDFHRKTFLALLVIVTIAFGWILFPMYGAVFWATILAILFAPFQRHAVARLRGRKNLAALITLGFILVLVILPLALVGSALLKEGSQFYERIHSRQFDLGAYFHQAMMALPGWMRGLLERFDLGDLSSMQQKLSNSAAQGSQALAAHAVNIGQNTLDFLVNLTVMLYILFFFLRDGPQLARRIRQAIPLSTEHKQTLLSNFTTVIRATVKGNIAVAAVQGLIGGIAFALLGVQGALLWGFLMALLSLLPAVGAALVWAPVAIYFLLTGAIWQGVVLILVGVFVIGLIDNVLRPILVGKDTRMPDYVVLVSTLGGIALVGLNGFVIGPVVAALFIAAWDLFSQLSDHGQNPSKDGGAGKG
ncbi:AI-2E family transporter [Noviherbaspirillum galbum]|uniref:AI-2E family transporter n=1 Tax=Noviherbaspirillum galbum TaxID=2709383 RepID=A0A6B3SJJ5_9BURK|nr:AI-2E family transporter [Noviherbaspirillum galbum]NEX61024.1 AI-2E family transporter [Noviherbaspirillum galbum]